MEMICFPILLPVIRHGYPTSIKKQNSNQCNGAIQLHQNQKKSKHTPYTSQKLMAAVFWDKKGVFSVDFMTHGTTITADVCFEMLNKLRRMIQNRKYV